MPSSYDVAAAFTHKIPDIPSTKLEKLCFLANAYHLAFLGQPLIEDECQAWQSGPVFPALFQAHRSRFTVSRSDFPKAKPIGGRGLIFIDMVCKTHSHLSGIELSKLTLAQVPLIEARARATPEAPQPVIDQEIVARYYRARLDAPTSVDAYAARFMDRYTEPIGTGTSLLPTKNTLSVGVPK